MTMKLFRLKVDIMSFKMICNMKDLDKCARSYDLSNSDHVNLEIAGAVSKRVEVVNFGDISSL